MTESCYEIMRSARDVNVTVMMGGCVGPNCQIAKEHIARANSQAELRNVTDMADISV